MKHPNTRNAAMYGEHFERYFWDEMDSFVSQILESKYEEVDPVQVAREQKHLTNGQQDDLAQLFRKYKHLFSGELGKYEGKKVHLEVEDGARPKYAKPYLIPHTQMDLFKEELMRLVNLEVLRPIGATQWAFQCLYDPRKIIGFVGCQIFVS